MKDYVICAREVFDKLIIVKANSEHEALEKCWTAFTEGTDTDPNPVCFDYLTDNSEMDYTIADKENTKMALTYPDYYDCLE